ncbi:MAG: hypothetical protein IPM48_03555 [Saprospiraceae bacterium]|nr:hypothetical protein [Saprospiraceae bacterium]
MKYFDDKQWQFHTLVFAVLAIFGILILSRPVDEAHLLRSVPNLIRIPFFENEWMYFWHHLLAAGPVIVALMVYPFFGESMYFYKKWMISILMASIPFIIWDYFFSKMGIWGFNSKFITSFIPLGFPIEEVLWFPVIGICSLFVHELLLHYKPLKTEYNARRGMIFIGVAALVLSVFNMDKMYTSLASLSVAGVVYLYWMKRFGALFILAIRSFVLLIIPMVLFDGYLTGMFTAEGLVIYHPEEYLGLRIISIPVEDFLFGFSFILSIIWIQKIYHKIR